MGETNRREQVSSRLSGDHSAILSRDSSVDAGLVAAAVLEQSSPQRGRQSAWRPGWQPSLCGEGMSLRPPHRLPQRLLDGSWQAL